MGQDAGLIHDIPPAGEIVTRIAQRGGGDLAEETAGNAEELTPLGPGMTAVKLGAERS